MLSALLLGLAGGFVLSIPPGPLSMAVAKQGLEGYFRAGFMIALGAAAMDVFYTLIAAFASSAIVVALTSLVAHNRWLQLGFQLACIIILLVLGIRYLSHKHNLAETDSLMRKELAQEEKAKKMGHSSPFFLGILIAFTNLASPTFLPSMIGFIGYLHANDLLSGGVGDNTVFSAGFGLGTSLWFFILLRVLLKNRRKLSGDFLSNVYRFAGSTFILFAALITYNVIRSTEWGALL
jgi:threonine/homoserine/homoserine lactone efflux protein